MNLISHNRINLQTNKSLINRQDITRGLCFIEDFLPAEDLETLQKFANESTEWEPYDIENQKNRSILRPNNWEYFSTFTKSFMKLTPQLKHIFKKPALYYGGFSLWRDQHKYFIAKHTDNPVIEIGLQVYLNDNSIPLPTTFVVDGVDVRANYKINAGYVMDNSEHLEHFFWPPIPKDETRHSLYIFWKTTTDD